MAGDGAALSDRAALQAVRRVLRGRAGLPSGADRAYAVYMAVMLLIIVVAPFVRTVVLLIGEAPPPGVSEFVVAAACGAVLVALAALAGAHTGPAHARLPEIDLLLSGGLPRALVLGRSVRRSFVGAALVGAAVAGLQLGGEMVDGSLRPERAIALLAAAIGVGLLAAGAMLLGQFDRRLRWAAAALFGMLGMGIGLLGTVLASTVSASTVPGRIALVGAASGAPVVLGVSAGIVLLALGLGAAFGSARFVSRVRRDTLREQSLRWNVVSTLALTGDLHMATERIGAPVRVGRSWSLPAQRSGTALILRRDLLGIARTPGRSIASALGIAGAGALLAGALSVAGAMRADNAVWGASAGALAVLMAFASLGPWCRGMRAAAGTVGGSALVPLSPLGLMLRHALVPALLAIPLSVAASAVTAVISASGSTASGQPFAAMGPAAGAGALLALLALGLRLFGALKGPLPQKLLAPVPTPAGDMAGTIVLMWSLDGIFWAVLIGAVLGALLVGFGLTWATLFALCATGLLAASLLVRLRSAGA